MTDSKNALHLWTRKYTGSTQMDVWTEEAQHNIVSTIQRTFVSSFGSVNVDKTRLSEIVVFAQESGTGTVYKVKPIRAINLNEGARMDQAGKASLITIINQFVGEPNKYTSENTKEPMISKIALSVMLEMLSRQFTETRRGERVYYLSPVQSIVTNVAKYWVR